MFDNEAEIQEVSELNNLIQISVKKSSSLIYDKDVEIKFTENMFDQQIVELSELSPLTMNLQLSNSSYEEFKSFLEKIEHMFMSGLFNINEE